MFFSFIIPLYNSNYIELQMKSILNLFCKSKNFECIYIDDGSDRIYQNLYKEAISKLPFEIWKKIYFYSLPEEKKNRNRVWRARNLWVINTKSDNIIFIDQETLLSPYYIKNLESKISNTVLFWPYYGYNNYIKKLSSNILKEFLKNGFILSPFFSDFRIGNKKVYDPIINWQYFCGSNFFIKKELFTLLGWFDEAIESWWDEDIELWYRLYKSGISLKFCEDIKVLNLSSKLYQTPYNIVEAKDVSSLSENWYKNIKKHKTREYVLYVKNRYQGLPDSHKTFVYPDLISFLRHENF